MIRLGVCVTYVDLAQTSRTPVLSAASGAAGVAVRVRSSVGRMRFMPGERARGAA